MKNPPEEPAPPRVPKVPRFRNAYFFPPILSYRLPGVMVVLGRQWASLQLQSASWSNRADVRAVNIQLTRYRLTFPLDLL
jgi:hypothetical protein